MVKHFGGFTLLARMEEAIGCRRSSSECDYATEGSCVVATGPQTSADEPIQGSAVCGNKARARGRATSFLIDDPVFKQALKRMTVRMTKNGTVREDLLQ